MSKKRQTRQETTVVSPRRYGASKKSLRILLTSWWVLGPVLLVMAVGLGWWLKIDGVAVNGGEAELTKKVVQDELGEHFLWNYTFLLPKNELKNRINQRSDHRYQEIVIEAGLNKLKITQKLRRPHLIWHAETAYVVDKSGVAYQKLASLEAKPQAVSVHDQAELPVEVPQSLLSEDQVSFLRKLPKEIPANSDFKVKKILVGETLQTIRIQTNKGIDLLMDPDYPLSSQLDNLKRTQKTAQKENKPIESYIDLRIPSRAFYQ